MTLSELKVDYYYEKYIDDSNEITGSFADYIQEKLESQEGIVTPHGVLTMENDTVTYTDSSNNTTIEGTFDSSNGSITIAGTTTPGDSNNEEPASGTTVVAGGTAVGENKEYTDTNSVTVTIPKGFTVSGISTEQTVATGLVIYDLAGDTVSDWNADTNSNSIPDVQENYNQFVWVPVSGSLARYEGYSNGSLQSRLSSCSEPYASGYSTESTEYNAMKDSVESNHGFYIARYEASKNATTNKVESKRGKSVCAGSFFFSGAVEQSKQMYPSENTDCGVTSKLIYGAEWDATCVFFDLAYSTGACESTSYVRDSSGKGNYSGSIANTGSNNNYAVKNIYDMAGNVCEITMESSGTTRVSRGGSYYKEERYVANTGYNYPVSVRQFRSEAMTAIYLGFRPTLYL